MRIWSTHHASALFSYNQLRNPRRLSGISRHSPIVRAPLFNIIRRRRNRVRARRHGLTHRELIVWILFHLQDWHPPLGQNIWCPHKHKDTDAESADDMTTKSCRHRTEWRSSRIGDDLCPQHVDIVDWQQHTSYKPADVRHIEEEGVDLAFAKPKLLHKSGDIQRDDSKLDKEEELQQVQVHPAARVHCVDQVRQPVHTQKDIQTTREQAKQVTSALALYAAIIICRGRTQRRRDEWQRPSRAALATAPAQTNQRESSHTLQQRPDDSLATVATTVTLLLLLHNDVQKEKSVDAKYMGISLVGSKSSSQLCCIKLYAIPVVIISAWIVEFTLS